MNIRTVLFDLDGTLADTAPDLARALNELLIEKARKPLPYEAIRPQVSHGAKALITLGFGLKPEAPEFDALRQRLLAIYRAGLCRETKLFSGMDAVLDALSARGCNWGVVTNKPAFLAEPLMAALGLGARAACIVSGDSTANRKPHPEPMRHACALAGSRPEQCLYVGDAERDITAGKNAGMKTLVALFGYIGENERPRDWGADGMITEPAGILTWLNGND